MISNKGSTVLAVSWLVGVVINLSYYQLALSGELIHTKSCGGDYFLNDIRGEKVGINLHVLLPDLVIKIGVLRPVDGPEYIYLVKQPGCNILEKISNPHDLDGYVSIQTSEDCIEYLRFFSLPETYSLTENDYVEICPLDQDPSDHDCWNFIAIQKWTKHNIPSILIRGGKLANLCSGKTSVGLPGEDGFIVTRPTLWIDNHVYLVTEEITREGKWFIIEKRDLGLTGDDLGTWFRFR